MKLSVIIPVHNGRPYIERCLQALQKSNTRPDEIIVVDDASTDGSAEAAAACGATLIRLPGPRNGPGRTRNAGAHTADGDILFFLDVDTVVHPDTLTRGVEALNRADGPAACFGSYDEHPADPGLVSQFKNLMHRHIHQQADRNADTFWCGCGAVKAPVFRALGGFNEAQYSLEDIEFGLRLRRAGHRIELIKDMCVTHLKKWTLRGLIFSDIFDRAIPWTALLKKFGGAGSRQLNLQPGYRLSVFLVNLAALLGLLSIRQPGLLAAVLPLLIFSLIPFRHLFADFARRRGQCFAAACAPLLLLYSLYCGPAFALGLMTYHFNQSRLIKNPSHWKFITGPWPPLLLTAVLLTLTVWHVQTQADEAMWSYIGRAWVEHGIPPYTGALENKPSGIFLIYALSYMIGGIQLGLTRAMGIVIMSATVLPLYALTRRLFSRPAAAVTAIVFGLAMTWGMVDGYAPGYTESFMNFFTVSACLAALSTTGCPERKKLRPALWAGVLTGLAVAFKQVAIFSAGAVFVLLVYDAAARRFTWKPVLCWVAGMLAVTAALLAPVLLSGVSLQDYWHEAWLILIERGGGGAGFGSQRLAGLRAVWLNSRLTVFYPFLLLFALQYKNIRQSARFPLNWLLVWLVLDVLAVNASGHYFGHQIKQVMPSFAILTGLGVGALIRGHMGGRKLERSLALVALPIIILLWFPYQPVRQTANRLRHPPEDRWKKIGSWIQTQTDPEDTIQVFGTGSSPILMYSNRRAPSRYFSNNFMRRRGAAEEMQHDLHTAPPTLIIHVTDAYIPENLLPFIAKHYRAGSIPHGLQGYTFYWHRPDSL